MTTRLSTLVAALLALAGPAAAQAPLPTELPFNAHVSVVRARLGRLGLHERPAARKPESTVFAAQRGGVSSELRTRFQGGVLVHAFYVAEGDSAALQREIDQSAASAAAKFGQPSRDAEGGRAWRLPGGRRFALPAAPARLPTGKFSFAVVYNRS
ncbi:MAG TPA: hypothetical protein VFJ82_22520 [Longimicrobium sp.]|nr:hypothetical protein [Longimicrobium sp.]